MGFLEEVIEDGTLGEWVGAGWSRQGEKTRAGAGNPDIFSHPHPQGGLYEAVNEVYKTLIPILKPTATTRSQLPCTANFRRPSPRSCTRWAQEALPAQPQPHPLSTPAIPS